MNHRTGIRAAGKRKILFLPAVILFICETLSGQYPVNYQYTLLPDTIIDKILGSSSGDLAMKHINGLAPYSRPRKEGEFPSDLKETGYITRMLKESGIKDFTVDVVGKAETWRGVEGTLWETSPRGSKIADYTDIPEMLVEGSRDTDARARLIWSGEGQQSFFNNNINTVKGKIVVTSGPPWIVHRRAMQAGAIGTISFYSSRSLTDPVQIPNMELEGEGFAFLLPPREGALLRDRLTRRENIEVQVKVRSATEQVDLQVIQCLIKGTDPAAGEVIFTAHLYEGYVKMGANDNMSGSAVILEVARLLNNLIESGEIPRPEHSIRFLWVPEFSGTIPWVNQNLSLVKNALCNLNLDMVGLRLRDSRSFLSLHRSGFSTAHYVNDVMESYYRYVGETNVENITDFLGRRGFSRRIVSPSGTDDPFYYRILSLHGSSDNAVFNDWSINIPGIKMNTWPDYYYHSSEDNPDKCDPTQLRRAVFIAAAGAYTIALGGSETALRIMSEMYASANARIGIQMGKSTDMIWKSDRTSLGPDYKRAVYNMEGLVLAEISAMEKLRQLSVKPEVLASVERMKEKLYDLNKLQVSALKEVMAAKCKALAVPEVQILPDEFEKNAMKTVPVPTDIAKTMGYSGERRYLSSVPADFIRENPYSRLFNTDEVAGMADGKRDLLQIKKMVDAQFETESPTEDIINFFNVLRKAGLMNFR